MSSSHRTLRKRQPSSLHWPYLALGSGRSSLCKEPGAILFSIFRTTCIRWELPDPSVGWNSFVKVLQFEALCVCVLSGGGCGGRISVFSCAPHTNFGIYIFFPPIENVSISPRPQTHLYTAVVGSTAVLNLYVCLSIMHVFSQVVTQSPDSWGTQGLWRGVLRGQVLTVGARQD